MSRSIKADHTREFSFDEITHFLESQFRFLIGWLRTTVPGQRCRVICSGNPPTDAEGDWIIQYWGPWLDKNHPNPAKPGELRWYVRYPGNDKDSPVESGAPFMHKGELITPQSRTFIPSHVEDNPFLMSTGYKRSSNLFLSLYAPRCLKEISQPAKRIISGRLFLRRGWRQPKPDGRKAARPDKWIPWVSTWPAAAGIFTSIATRYGKWYDKIKKFPGSDTPNGPIVAGLIISALRDAAPIHIDIGGGYGGSPYDHLEENGFQVIGINNASTEGIDGQFDKASQKLRFRNIRAFLYWRFRESLEPEKGDDLALPRIVN